MKIEFRRATLADLERLWEDNIAANPGDDRWISWRKEYIAYNRQGMAQTFAAVCDGYPVGEVTLLLDPRCAAVGGRTTLADGEKTANVNALRIQQGYQGKGYATSLMKALEKAAAAEGITRLTIGVEAQESRNLAIYLHWGYDRFVMAEKEDDTLVLYYQKTL